MQNKPPQNVYCGVKLIALQRVEQDDVRKEITEIDLVSCHCS